MPDSVPATETANIHLQVHGEDRVFPVEFALGQQPVGALLPVARQLSHELITITLNSACQDGKTVSCKAGCGACCRQLVAISLAEAQSLAEVVAAMPAERQAVIRGRFDAAIQRLEQVGLLDAAEPQGQRALLANQADYPAVTAVARRYFRQQIACPFLEDESCSIHPDRPLVCRGYHVTSPAEDCARLYEVPIESVEPPIHLSDVMTEVTHKVAGSPLATIPLILSLEWSEAHPEVAERKADGLELLQTLMGEIDRQYSHGFDERDAVQESP
jgi:Fe-S-cluster containining protein